MATAFEDLRSEDELRRRARGALIGYPTDLPIPARGAPPPQQTAQGGLPPGYSEIEPPKAAGGLPPGYSEIATEAPAPAGPKTPLAEPVNEEDPFERAAIRQTRYAKGPRKTGGFEPLQAGINLAEQGYRRFDKFAEQAIKSGDLSPEDAMNVAMSATPPGVAYRTGAAIARAARTLPEQQQLETKVLSIPRAAAGGETMQTLGRSMTGVPIIGSGVRKAAQRSTEELQAAGTAAAAKPTGVVPGQDEAGNLIRSALERASGEGQGTFGAVGVPAAAAPSKTFKTMLGKSDEDMVGQIARMSSETKAGANVEALAHVRGAVPAESWPTVQGALIERMGKAPATGEFSPGTWVRQYGSMSEKAKSIVFGPSGSSLRTHLDAIEGVSRRAQSWQQLHQGRAALGTAVGTVGLIGTAYGAVTDPMSTLQTVIGTTVPLGIMARWLSRPATAAPIAQWSKAYERMARSGGAPQALAAFTMATRNMANSLGINVSVGDFLGGSKNGQPVE